MGRGWIECCFVVVFVTRTGFADGASISQLKNLHEQLFTNYSTEFRPLYDQSERINLTASFYLLDITNFDDVRQEFMCNGILNISWKDEFLKWNPDDFGGVMKFTFVREYKSWFPSITVTNSLGKRDVFSDDAQTMTVHSSGDVIWMASAIFKTACSLNTKRFPFDIQECDIFLMPVHFTTDEVHAIAGSDQVILDLFKLNGEWDIIDNSFSVVIFAQVYKWDIKLIFQRRPFFYILNLIIPIVILSFLNMTAFAVPAESGEKLSFSVTVLLALTVHLAEVKDLVPRSSLHLTMLNGYLTSLTALSAIIVILNILILRLYNKGVDEHVPEYLQKLVRITGPSGQKKPVKADDSTPEERPVQWADVSKSLDYVLLRVVFVFHTVYTVGFLIIFVTTS